MLVGQMSFAEEKPVVTALNRIVEKDNITLCANGLLSVGNDLIGDKAHRLLNTSVDASLVTISGVLHYNDRPSHLAFVVNQTAQKQCVVRYRLHYQLDVPCLTAREEAFKKWIHQGKLDSHTHVYRHKRDARKTAHLSDISRGLQCLVSVYFSDEAKKNVEPSDAE